MVIKLELYRLGDMVMAAASEKSRDRPEVCNCPVNAEGSSCEVHYRHWHIWVSLSITSQIPMYGVQASATNDKFNKYFYTELNIHTNSETRVYSLRTHLTTHLTSRRLHSLGNLMLCHC